MRALGRGSLRRRITIWLLVYAAALTLAVVAQGTVVIEYVERIVWRSLLTVELDHFVERHRLEPGYRVAGTPGLRVYASTDARDAAAMPEVLRGLDEGLHDDLRVGDTEVVALVRDYGGERYTLAMDIEQFSREESRFELLTLAAALAMLLLVSLSAALGVSYLLRPLSQLAGRIGALQPARGAAEITLERGAGSELTVIADAFNDFLRRNRQFVERETTFVNTASHELRTPIAVINGAAELGLQPGADPASMREQLERIRRSAREMDHLVTLLLALAKDPAKLARSNEPLALHVLLPEVVEDHRHLTVGKSLQLNLEPLPECEIHAPPGIVRAAIGNLLRNAIENSDQGVIDIALDRSGTVTIRDPGHGLSPEQISAIYLRMARGGGESGIGLDLIARLCDHFGWRLSLQSDAGRGTTAVLQLGAG